MTFLDSLDTRTIMQDTFHAEGIELITNLSLGSRISDRHVSETADIRNSVFRIAGSITLEA
jgi:hypothetical protein